MADLWRVFLFVPLPSVVPGSLHLYRKQMLDMDKELIFDDVSVSRF